MAHAHFFVSILDRVAPTPATPGTGWFAEVYLDLPDVNTSSIITSEAYIKTVEPDFTFRCSYIDFPAGPVDSALDAELATIGDFLDGAIWDVSDPPQLAAPMSNFFIRFTGLIDVRVEHSSQVLFGLPVLLDFGTHAYGGYRTRVGITSIYRVNNHVFNEDPFFSENALVDGMGLFPIEVTYLNDYDTGSASGQERVGVELYGFHPGGLPWPGGAVFVDPKFGPMTITPPRFVYQPEDIAVPNKADFDQDRTVTLADYAALQRCAGDGGPVGDSACRTFDFDNNDVIDTFDFDQFTRWLEGPLVFPIAPGDVTADSRVDLADFRWVQTCFEVAGGGDDDRALRQFKQGCEAIDFDLDGRITLSDFAMFNRIMSVPSLDP